METHQEEKSVDRWHLHPDAIATRYATAFSQMNSYEIGSQTYFDVMHEVQQRIDAGIASGKLKLRSWPGRFVLAPSSTITNKTLVDLQDFCDAADALGIDCPKNACDLAQTFRLPSMLPAPASALAAHDTKKDIPLKSSTPDRARDALGSGKVWTPEKLAEMEAYRELHGTKKTAKHYEISPQRVRILLPGKKPIQTGHSVFTLANK